MRNITDLAYWITERDLMRERKEHLDNPRPEWAHGWSDDPNMGLIRYCNVRREDDKVTRWLAQHWRPQHNTLWELTLARMLNHIPTLEVCLPILQWQDPLKGVLGELKLLRATGAKVFTSAYTISTAGKSMDKLDYVVDWVVGAVKNREIASGFKPRRLAEAAAWLEEFDGLGSFLAAQVVADAKNTLGHPLKAAPDWQTWCAPGPGSLRGLTALRGRTITPAKFYGEIFAAWEEVKPLLPEYLQSLHMQDFQNCLCEFSKYSKALGGEGRPRNGYIARRS
jgi:alpha-glutamyl/putrescinyl thymine pyrophosphorylase clade 1